MPLVSQMRRYQNWLEANRGLRFSDYESLRQWSIADQCGFWASIWSYDGLESPTPFESVLSGEHMPGARWFSGASVNYARHVFRHAESAAAAGQPAIIMEDESGRSSEFGWLELRRAVNSLAVDLRRRGVGRGDRVVAYLPNRAEAIVAFLACASIGAIWSVCAPDMGSRSVLDRFRQISPKMLIATDGVFYAGKAHDKSAVVRDLIDELPSLKHVLMIRSPYAEHPVSGTADFREAVAHADEEVARFEPEWLPFDHPLWVLYTSGTTGLPKALVHGHGGIILAAATNRLHIDLGPSYAEETLAERYHWYTSTGWMMWNAQIGGLLGGTTICIFDGSPFGSRTSPDWQLLWRFVDRHAVTFMGAGAPFHAACAKAGLDLAGVGTFSRLRALGSTAAPLPCDVQIGVSAKLAAVGKPDLWWYNSSGGTDICGAFCTGNRDLPMKPGTLQCRQLGAAVEAWNETGHPVVGTVGELVCTKPLPSMPLFLWGDESGDRYRNSYFDRYPGVWRHGDWLQIDTDGSCQIFGRSDATINRGGHRLGTSEIYAAVEILAEVADSLAIDVANAVGESSLFLFVVLTGNTDLDAGLRDRIDVAIRERLSPRFVPDHVIAVAAVPRTLSAKKQELPIKRLFEGQPLEAVIDESAMANPESLAEYVALAQEHRRTTRVV